MSTRCLLVLLLTCPLAAAGLSTDELLDFADGRVVGHVIDDESRVVIGVIHGRANFQTRLVLWAGTEAKTLDVDYGGDFPILFKQIQAVAEKNDAFILKGAMKVDDSEHGAVAYQAYRLTSRGKLRRLWSIDTRQWVGDDASIEFSPDGTMWGTMAHYGTEGRHFALGSTRSMEPKRSETLVFHEDRPRLMDSEFRFLSSDGPVLLAPYGDGVYLLRFTDFGVDSRRIEHLEAGRAFYGGSSLPVHWQSGDRVLWSDDGQEWTAWDLWDLGLSGFPDEPFFRLESSSGEPHPVRGFVRKTVTDRSYRVEYLWRSPRIEHLNERHVSDWRPGKPISISVSPKGLHAVALEEVREEKDGKVASHQVLRRFELAPVPPPPLASVFQHRSDATLRRNAGAKAPEEAPTRPGTRPRPP
ncbi:MAG: hypothetical protein OXF79_23710 [Chloroflexi bacterium]|nr:hypothetical protein [Chloroflexota bacterium]